MSKTPRTWFGVITESGRELTLTVAMTTLIVAATVLSATFPAAGSWLSFGTALLGAWWYTHMMRRLRAARRIDDGDPLLAPASPGR